MRNQRLFTTGQRVWLYDDNRRVYERDARGHATGSPIYESGFQPHVVDGIDGRSYLIRPETSKPGFARKVGFAKAEKAYLTDAQKEEDVWTKSHRNTIVDMVRKADFDTLRRVAAVVGFPPPEGG